MAGSPGSMSALSGPLVRVVTDNVVSSSSMVSRVVLRDSWLGLLIVATDGTLWLAATTDALAPDPEGLIVRGAARGGPPVEHGSPRLVKVRLNWGAMTDPPVPGGEAEVANPMVITHPGGTSIAAIRLARTCPLIEAIETGTGPTPVRIADGFGEIGPTADVLSLVEDDAEQHWPILRTAAVVSEAGFFGEQGAVTLGLELQKADSGAPAYSASRLAGLVRPLGKGISLLLPADAIAETIASAQS